MKYKSLLKKLRRKSRKFTKIISASLYLLFNPFKFIKALTILFFYGPRVFRAKFKKAVKNKFYLNHNSSFRFFSLLLSYTVDPKKIVKGLKILFTQGPQAVIEKMKSKEIQNQKILSINQKYQIWVKNNFPTNSELNKQEKYQKIFKYQPVISIITPVYNTPIKYLERCIESVVAQSYKKWELILIDDGSSNNNVKDRLKALIKKDRRIISLFLKRNHGISKASNEGLKIANGEFIGLLDHDDELTPDALYENVKILNKNKRLDMTYSDEDKIDIKGKLYDPFFKPDWSPHLLLSVMYTGHFTVYRKILVKRLGGFRSKYDFSQDYDLALRVTEKTDKIYHIPKILYHWRALPESGASVGGKTFARKVSIKALNDALKRRKYEAEIKEYPYTNRVIYKLKDSPLVSIIVPSDNYKIMEGCIRNYLINTNYKHFEFIVVTNSLVGTALKKKFGPKIEIVKYDKPFNISDKCNVGAKKAKGEYLVFINDDTIPVTKDWIESLLEQVRRKDVGAVACKLLYRDGSIQHAGLITGVREFIGTAFHQLPKDSLHYFNFAQTIRNTSALSFACAMISKKIFNEVGGFDGKNTPIRHSDVDLCFRIREKGYLLVYTPFAEVIHFGHQSISKTEERRSQILRGDPADLYILNRYGKFIAYDPYFPNNMRFLLHHDGTYNFKLFAKNNKNSQRLKLKKIALISHELTLSGAPLLLFNISKYLYNKYYLTIISPTDGPLRRYYEELNIPVVVDSLILEGSNIEFKKFLASFNLLILNTILTWRLTYVGRSINKPTLWSIHESSFGKELCKNNPLIAHAFSLATCSLFDSKNNFSLYKSYLRKKNMYKIIVQGIAPPLVQNKNVVNNSNKVRILQAGTIEKRKGQDILIDAINKLPYAYKEKVQLDIIGRVWEPKFMDMIQKKARSLHNVKFHKPVEHQELAKYYQLADMFVMPSRDEVIPLSIQEAMFFKKPIIAAAVGGIPEIIKHGVNGILFQKENSKELANRVEELVDNPMLRLKLGARAHQDFRNRYIIDVYGKKLTKLINGLI